MAVKSFIILAPEVCDSGVHFPTPLGKLEHCIARGKNLYINEMVS
jgi:hypothetical protein